jgi:predicted NAD/FAD-binding protein
MLADLLRFNRATTALLRTNAIPQLALGAYLDREGYSAAFRDWYLLPMAAAIWSSPRREILDFPLPSFLRFCHNHGLLQVFDRPQWRTVAGGARTYVARIAAELPDVRVATPVERLVRHYDHVFVHAGSRADRYDEVVLACHSDQARMLLTDATEEEDELLAAVRYQSNRVVLHTDPALLPRSQRAWAAWNHLAADDPDGTRPVAVSYLINKLQPLPCRTPVIVTLNPPFAPQPHCVLREFEYAHPLLDGKAVAAQAGLQAIQGHRRTWFAGAWLGHGFHEDGLASAHAVAAGIAAVAAPDASPRAPVRIAA